MTQLYYHQFSGITQFTMRSFKIKINYFLFPSQIPRCSVTCVQVIALLNGDLGWWLFVGWVTRCRVVQPSMRLQGVQYVHIDGMLVRWGPPEKAQLGARGGGHCCKKGRSSPPSEERERRWQQRSRRQPQFFYLGLLQPFRFRTPILEPNFDLETKRSRFTITLICM